MINTVVGEIVLVDPGFHLHVADRAGLLFAARNIRQKAERVRFHPQQFSAGALHPAHQQPVRPDHLPGWLWLEFLWAIPADNSWLALVGIFGHAFITTALLASSFIYYHDMTTWLQTVLARLRGDMPTNRLELAFHHHPTVGIKMASRLQ